VTAPSRIVLAMPAYGRPDSLAQSLESILGQTRTDFALMIVDDGPTGATDAIIDRYLQRDPRISYERNPKRLGMVKNWRKCFARAREVHAQSEYFAWVSDHDFWHPRWLARLVAELDAHPGVVLAYPQTLKFYTKAGARVPGSFETFGVKDPVERVRRAAEGMFAGDMIYGLFRTGALEAAGVFRPVLLPDRQVLAALAAFGEFRLVPEVLWYRQAPQAFSLERQREAFFTGTVPLYTYLPYHVQHCGLMLWDFAIRGRGGTRLDRTTGVRAAAAQLSASLNRERAHRQATRAGGRTSPDDAPGEGDDPPGDERDRP
jgi:glycosyltransferase involved in cell wall biosynthesis